MRRTGNCIPWQVALWGITVNGNWRLTFTFNDENAELVDYLDYH